MKRPFFRWLWFRLMLPLVSSPYRVVVSRKLHEARHYRDIATTQLDRDFYTSRIKCLKMRSDLHAPGNTLGQWYRKGKR